MTAPVETLTLAEVARALHCSLTTVYRLIRRKRLRARHLNGKAPGRGQGSPYRVTVDALREYLGGRAG